MNGCGGPVALPCPASPPAALEEAPCCSGGGVQAGGVDAGEDLAELVPVVDGDSLRSGILEGVPAAVASEPRVMNSISSGGGCIASSDGW